MSQSKTQTATTKRINKIAIKRMIDESPDASYLEQEGLGFEDNPTWARVKHLCRDGRYLVRVTRHVFTVVDGVAYDPDLTGPRCRVKGILKLEAL